MPGILGNVIIDNERTQTFGGRVFGVAKWFPCPRPHPFLYFMHSHICGFFTVSKVVPSKPACMPHSSYAGFSSSQFLGCQYSACGLYCSAALDLFSFFGITIFILLELSILLCCNFYIDYCWLKNCTSYS